MKKILLTIAILAVGSTTFLSQTPSKVAGAYQWCPFECETYNIKADFTFEYLVDGDLFNNQRTKGTWEFVGKNRIHLASLFKKIIRNVKEVEGSNDSLKVIVLDQAGAVVPGIAISFEIAGKTRNVTTNDSGEVVIPKAEKVAVAFRNYTEAYKMLDPKTDELVIEIEYDFVSKIDDEFMLEKNSICKILDDGDTADCHIKISSKHAKELFPDK